MGYWQKPEITEAAFLPDPESGNRRIYRTSDIGRLLPDGSIEFVERKDRQVKIRGFRVELGEIESVLGGHPAMQEVAVLAREDEPGEIRLVAYVVPKRKQEPTISELHRFLKEKLPQYMLPSAFVMVDALSLTPSGKVDRRALPAPDTFRPVLEQAFVAPCGPIEEILAGIWARLLRLERIGVHDNFFDLGGHSLLATQIISRLCGAFQIDLPLRSLFEAPTVAELARDIGQKKIEQIDSQRLAQRLAELEQQSDDEVRRLLNPSF